MNLKATYLQDDDVDVDVQPSSPFLPNKLSSCVSSTSTSSSSPSSASSYNSMLCRNRILEQQNELLSSKCNRLIDILHNIPVVLNGIDFFKYSPRPSSQDIIDIISLKLDFLVHMYSLKCLDPELCSILHKHTNTDTTVSWLVKESYSPKVLVLNKS